MSLLHIPIPNDPTTALGVLRQVWNQLRPILTMRKEVRLWLTISLEKRTTPQNAKFHAITTDLQRSRLTWAGKPRDARQWKSLLISGHAVATSEGAEIVPGLENEFINIRESSALMSIERGSSLIEYSIAFCASNDVELHDPSDWLRWGLAESLTNQQEHHHNVRRATA